MSFIKQVVEFNQRVLKIDQRSMDMLSPEEFKLSCKCLQEELDEFKEAHEKGDFVGCIDGLVDLMYFANGVLYKMGLSADAIEQCCTAVHEANMEKKLGVVAKRETGAADAVKPAGWVSPETRIMDILDRSEEQA